MTGIRVAHLSDTHVGFTQYPKKTPSGRPVREQDFVRAFAAAIDDIKAYDPPLVIHSGDFYDRPVVSLRHQVQGQAALEELAVRADGTRRCVVVISGNHDQPSDPREPCALELDSPIEGVHIVTSAYTQLDLGSFAHTPRELSNVVVHCIPHDVLRTLDFDEVQPVPGKVNILTCHGVVGGSALYKRTIGREYPLPIDVVVRDWDYVAMGHWHKRGPVAVGGYSPATTRVWYAGSTENNGFADVHGCTGGEGRGYLQVEVQKGEVPVVHGVDLPVRAMFKLPTVEAAGLSAAELSEAMRANITESDIHGAVVAQVVNGVTRDTWALLDHSQLRTWAADAVWYEAKPQFADTVLEDGEPAPVGSDAVGILGEVATQLLNQDQDLNAVVEYSKTLLQRHLGEATDSSEEGAA